METDFRLGFVVWWCVHWYSSHRSWVRSRTQKSVLSHSFILFRPVSVEHLAIYLQPGQLKTQNKTNVVDLLSTAFLLMEKCYQSTPTVLTIHVWMVCSVQSSSSGVPLDCTLTLCQIKHDFVRTWSDTEKCMIWNQWQIQRWRAWGQ